MSRKVSDIQYVLIGVFVLRRGDVEPNLLSFLRPYFKRQQGERANECSHQNRQTRSIYLLLLS